MYCRHMDVSGGTWDIYGNNTPAGPQVCCPMLTTPLVAGLGLAGCARAMCCEWASQTHLTCVSVHWHTPYAFWVVSVL